MTELRSQAHRNRRFGKGKALATMAVLVLGGLLLLSPYRNHDDSDVSRLINTVEIDAPVESVFDFLGDSRNASIWSSYVSHITVLGGEDGAVGSTRRCFQDASEAGRRWDEEIVKVLPNRARELTIYNLHDFPITADGLLTEQQYEQLPGDRTKLTFTLRFDEAHGSALEHAIMRLAAYRIDHIFTKNLANIKQVVEDRVYGA